MKEALVFIKNAAVDVHLHDSVGTNPKDWKFPSWFPESNGTNTGDDIAGYVHEVAADVVEFKPGGRVASFHDYRTLHGSFGEYDIGKVYATFHIPDHITFEEAATVPVAATTAALALFARLGLPEPWLGDKEWATKPPPTPPPPRGGALVYGPRAPSGCLRSSCYRRRVSILLLGLRGRGVGYVDGLLSKSKGDVVVDYRDSEKAVVAAISGPKCGCGVDCYAGAAGG
ncbi:hypothetical protein BDV29DRAFT_156628 [Aspergillus leporis]|uniref:Uncharacterized protein n=1 Tax=Aspergillus leporis TaxID=41062 RepID=A0A5N5X4R4_9EURO|nr:hypothetical protein BDV29DRAFT_156628 [Aspergillus leporis]